MDDATGQRPEEIDEESRFVRWATSPEGVLYQIKGGTTFGVTVPLGLEADSGGETLRRVLGILNRGLVRVQRSSTVESGAWVSVKPAGDELAVYGLNCENLREAREHAVQLATQIENGTLELNQD